MIAIGLASGMVNGPLKFAWRRPRPPLEALGRRRSLLAVPGSYSFPSGHAASAFAFATGVGLELPAAAVPVGALAATVAYSRVRAGVHYPSDVVAGAGLGVFAGLAAGPILAAGQRRLLSRVRREGLAGADNGVPRRVVLLTSANAGSAGGLDRARAALVEAGFQIIGEVAVQHSHELGAWVSGPAAEMPLILAAGGDGTVGAAADRVIDTGAVLGVLPLGTSNDFARSLGIPTDPVRAARLLATGKVATVDAGRLIMPGQPARHFVHAATVGLNVSFAKLATEASMRRRFGRLTYAVAGVSALRGHERFDCELRYDSRVDRLRLVHLSVINAPVFGGFLGMRVRGARLDDRTLDIIAVEQISVRRLLLVALQPVLGIRRPVRGVRTLRVRELRVHTGEPLDVALDGEILGRTPADFEVAGKALRIVTPQDFEDVDDRRPAG